MSNNALLLINSVLLILTLPMAMSVLQYLLVNRSANYHIRYALIFSFALIVVTIILSLYVNFSIYFMGKIPADLFIVANIRNLIKNSALFAICLTFWIEKK